MNFEELEIRLRELYDKIRSQDYSVNESYDTVTKEFNEVFLSTINASVIEKKYFSCSPLDVYKIYFIQEIETAKIESFDFYEDEYLKNEYLYQVRVLKLQRHSIHKFTYYLHLLDQLNYNLFISIHKKRIQYLEELLYKIGIEVNISVPTEEFESPKTTFIKNFNLSIENDNLQPLKPEPKKRKQNKSLLFDGKELNLSERYNIAKKVVNIEKQIRKLNLKELEKHRLLAYILGCDITNARNLYNGTYNSKDRDLSNFFNELNLNE